MNKDFLKRLMRRPDVMVETFLKTTFRRYLSPKIGEFAASGTICTDAYVFLNNLLGSSIPDNEWSDYLEEWKKLNYGLSQRKINSLHSAGNATKYLGYDSDLSNVLVIYILARLVKPKVIVETGVANGVSTYFLLNAIKYNDCGKLYSIDVSQDVGSILSINERVGWNLIILDSINAKGLRRKLSFLDNIDLFIHDSDHSYKWQKLEYSLALEKMAQQSFLLSDDVDSSYAFMDTFKGGARVQVQYSPSPKNNYYNLIPVTIPYLLPSTIKKLMNHLYWNLYPPLDHIFLL